MKKKGHIDMPFGMDKPQSSMSVRLHSKHGGMMPKKVSVGAKHAVRVLGRITGLRSDQFGHSMDMDLDSLEHDTDNDKEEGEPKSLTAAMKKRNRKMHNGQFA